MPEFPGLRAAGTIPHLSGLPEIQALTQVKPKAQQSGVGIGFVIAAANIFG